MKNKGLFLQLSGSAVGYHFITRQKVTDAFFGTSCASENGNEFRNFRSLYTFDSFRCSCMTNDYEIVIGNDVRNISFVEPSAR
jgi:hypothetical protein